MPKNGRNTKARGENSYELEFTRQKGEKIYNVVSPKPLFDAQGNFEGSFAIVTDVNRLKAVEKALRKSQEELIRERIRQELGLKNRRTNLQAYLNSLR